MSKPTITSSTRETPSLKGEYSSPVQESSRDSTTEICPLVGTPRADIGNDMVPAYERDHTSYRAEFPNSSPNSNSPPPRPRSAPVDWLGARQNLRLQYVDASFLSCTPEQYERNIPCRRFCDWQECQKRLSLPGTKGTVEVKRYLGIDNDDLYNGWIEADQEDDEWSVILDESMESVDQSQAPNESTPKKIKQERTTNDVIEHPNPQHPRVHPLFAARYGNDPCWGSLVE
ncbi:hypothetical protein F4781DRAFT_438897 [Annulohypoxylon bovei var. microspora]|nr:hypothetical protein F4781DRAFT_438897 [Annulohypoxylon bovei var. microspora]